MNAGNDLVGQVTQEINLPSEMIEGELYNPIHFHAGHISGAGYLKVPDDFGKTIQKQKLNTHGFINFIHGSK